MAKHISIKRADGKITLVRSKLETASENKLTDDEIIINELYERIQILSKSERKFLTNYLEGFTNNDPFASIEKGIDDYFEKPSLNEDESVLFGFNEKSLDQFLPDNFKGLSKSYIMNCVFNNTIQKDWKPRVGDVIIGITGNVFVISASQTLVEELGGTVFFFGGGLRTSGNDGILNETYNYALNKTGKKFIRTSKGIDEVSDMNYSRFSDYRYVPYPHELNN